MKWYTFSEGKWWKACEREYHAILGRTSSLNQQRYARNICPHRINLCIQWGSWSIQQTSNMSLGSSAISIMYSGSGYTGPRCTNDGWQYHCVLDSSFPSFLFNLLRPQWWTILSHVRLILRYEMKRLTELARVSCDAFGDKSRTCGNDICCKIYLLNL